MASTRELRKRNNTISSASIALDRSIAGRPCQTNADSLYRCPRELLQAPRIYTRSPELPYSATSYLYGLHFIEIAISSWSSS